MICEPKLIGYYSTFRGYDVPYNCLVTTREDYQKLLKELGGNKELEKKINQFFEKHPRAERVVVDL